MQNYTSSSFARTLADQMVAKRFAKDYGTKTFAEYLDLLDERSTAHLAEYMAHRVRNTAGAQRRRARLKLEGSGTVVIAVPMNESDIGELVWAELELSTWFLLMEMGAEGAWFYAHKGPGKLVGQVRTSAPISARTPNKNATIARLIANAKPGQQAKTLDRNPLNLRRDNLNLIGHPKPEGQPGLSKTDSAALLREHKALWEALAGSGYDMTGAGAAQ